MIDGLPIPDFVKVRDTIRVVVPELPVFCSFVPPSATPEEAGRCVLISRPGISETRIEVRLGECVRASGVADDILAALENAGWLRAVLARFDVPSLALGIDVGGHVVECAVG